MDEGLGDLEIGGQAVRTVKSPVVESITHEQTPNEVLI